MAMDVVDCEIKGAEMQFVEVELDPGQAAVGEAGSLFFMDTGIDMDTVFGDGSHAAAKSCPWTGGEGLFFAKLTGAGTVWLQSLPLSRLASHIFAAAPQKGGRREESALGGLAVGGGLLGGILGG